MRHFDHEAIGYYWPAILAYLVREPGYDAWWESLFTRLYLARQRLTGAERHAMEGVLKGLVTEPAVQPVEQAILAAFLAFRLESTESVVQVVTDRIQQTLRELLEEPAVCGDLGEVEHLWTLAHPWQAQPVLRQFSLERCLLLERLLAGPRSVSASLPLGRDRATSCSSGSSGDIIFARERSNRPLAQDLTLA